MINFIKKNKLLVLFLISILIPFAMSTVSLYTKTMPFWFDPARDFLQALSNQHKLTLIGQPTGIPGLFYGPYWIWLLSIVLFISKDPRVVQFLVLTLPYYTIFPFILWKLKSIFDFKIIITLWILFIFSFIQYTIFPWNPHLAPLCVLGVFYLIITAKMELKREFYVKTFLAGFITGFIGNFHLSFDIGLSFGIFVFFLYFLLISVRIQTLKLFVQRCAVFSVGFAIAFIPLLVFDMRHGFNQIKTVLHTLGSPYAVVGLKGLSQNQIIARPFEVFSELLKLPQNIATAVAIICGLVFIAFWLNKKIKFDETEKKAFALSISVFTSILVIFLTSKNPVWDYHFIAIEIIFLFLLGILMKKVSTMKSLFFIWAILLGLWSFYSYFLVAKPSVLSYDTLGKKEYLVNLVNNDAKGQDYTVFAYNPGIYSYDYSYLFKWMVGKNVPYDPGQIKRGGKLIYLIIQKTDPGIFQDYVNYHSPGALYRTTGEWKIPDGTIVLKRESLKR